MIRRIAIWICLLWTASVLWAGDSMLYSLQQVSSVKNGGQYVFVQGGRAITHNESNSGLETVALDVTQPISASDACVWTLSGKSGNFYLTYSEGDIVAYLSVKSDSKHDLQFNIKEYSHSWSVSVSEGVFKIEHSSRYLSISGDICFAEKKGDCSILVYQLVPCNYTRTDIATNQIGTICLPFATESYSGATFYALVSKETDASGTPTTVYYEQVSSQLEAGKPYVYVPQDDATSLSFTAAEGTTVSTPNNYNGFIGTFSVIDDSQLSTKVLEGNYMIYNNQIRKCGTNCGMYAYRAYINMNQVPDASQASAPSRRLLVIGQHTDPSYIDPGIMTGMQNAPCTMQHAQCTMQNGRIVIVRGDECYDVAGRRLQ